MTDFWVSSSFATGFVRVDHADIIVDSIAIFSKFKGQHIDRLKEWLVERSSSLVYIEKLGKL